MARKKHHPDSAAQTLDLIESRGDQLARWVAENRVLVLGVAAGILVAAGIWGLASQQMRQSRDESAAALAEVMGDYRVAMGGTPGSLELAEPANPETARRIRTEYVALFTAMAAAHEGTTAGALALLEAGKLQQTLGEPEAAIASYESGLEQVGAEDPVRGFLLTRLASVYEAEGRWIEAGDTHSRAAEVADFPLRYEALADAARCYAQAGSTEQAVAAYARIESEAPDYRLAPYVEARLDELRGRPSAEVQAEDQLEK